LAILLALTGGVFGIVTVIPLELPHVLSLMAAILWAPVFEELAKPIGVYVLLARWPATLGSRWRTAILCALGGLSFGLVESCIYMFVYFRDHGQALLLFRFTVPPLMHTVASFVFGLGLTTDFFSSLGRGLRPRAANWAFFLSAMLIHAYYNGMAMQFASFQVFNEMR
jgi:RsiW-degrading membrane proteinase PrsW (M82 family)